jgi:putative ABC transport system substrate-binding protein
MMERRTFLTMAAGGLLAAPLAAVAQPAGNPPRIALVFGGASLADMTGSEPRNPYAKAFLHALRGFGWVEGQNLHIERRSVEGKSARATGIFAEAAALRVDVIVTGTTEYAREARRATSTIPIVLIHSTELVASGLAASVARPGGNVTGLEFPDPRDMWPKRLQLLQEVVPGLKRVGLLSAPDRTALLTAVQRSLLGRGLQVELLDADSDERMTTALATIARRGFHGLGFGFAQHTPYRTRIAQFAISNRLPTVATSREFAEAGALLAYDASLVQMATRAADYVNKILKGARPGELPIEQPTKLDLLINLKIAKALGLTIPQSLLLRADQVIE